MRCGKDLKEARQAGVCRKGISGRGNSQGEASGWSTSGEQRGPVWLPQRKPGRAGPGRLGGEVVGPDHVEPCRPLDHVFATFWLVQMLASSKCSRSLTASSQHSLLISSHTNEASTLVSRHAHATHPHTCTPVSRHTRSSPSGLCPPSRLCGWESGRPPTSLAPTAAAAGPLPGQTRTGRK